MRLIFLLAFVLTASAQQHWVASWAAAAAPPPDSERMRALHLDVSNATIRETVHLSLGGSAVRVRLSNVFAAQPVRIAEARLTGHPLTVSGRASFEIPAGAILLTDPVAMPVKSLADLEITLRVEGAALAGGVHFQANATSYVGDEKVTSWMFLAGVDVLAPASASTIVALGDSITDGSRSTPDANKRWPNVLAARVAARGLAVVDLGIGGNRMLHDGATGNRPDAGVAALARFDRDVLAQPGVKYLIVLEGINDIGHPGSSAPAGETVTAADLIAALTQMAERAHENGIRIFAGTVTPFESDANKARGYFTPAKEQVRLAFNQWIRTAKVLDGFIDFEKTVGDPSRPNVILKSYDSGDGLHPSDAGYTAMGESIPLTLFR